MKKIIVFDTSVGSRNLGDQIINNSFDIEMNYIINTHFSIKMATHTPTSHFYQNIKRNALYRYSSECCYKFVAGTNLIGKNMLRPWPTWNINVFNCGMYKNSVLVGVGSSFNEGKINAYTRFLYKKILSKEYIHSTRDEKTKIILESLGFKAVNTGCVTMWRFTETFCKRIPSKKSNNVVFTLTDYNRDEKKDQLLINILNKNYENIYFWAQGDRDLEYFKSFNNINNINIINPSLDNFRKYLLEKKTDYVGTRLHAGIFAMQNYARSIIIIIDNRARDIQKNYNIVAIERDTIDKKLDSLINSEFETKINIDERKINEWKLQFK